MKTLPDFVSDEDPRLVYLDLLKRALLNWIYRDAGFSTMYWSARLRFLNALVRPLGARVILPDLFDPERRLMGSDWPQKAHTMIGWKRLDNIQTCVETVLREAIPGDLVETGVWRGGACILMRGILKAYGVKNRTVWVADSFRGLPKPRLAPDQQTSAGQLHQDPGLAVSLKTVRDHFARYGLLDEQVSFLEGWFHESLPAAPIERIAVLRLDGDLYESTLDALTHLYPKLSAGGFLIVDDYNGIATCAKAVQDYRAGHQIEAPLQAIDATGVFWRKP